MSHAAEPQGSQSLPIADPTPIGLICLAGKRIPPHPAMTRYLMGHEYGHGVFYHLARLRGFEQDSEGLRKLYQALRPETSSRSA